MFDEILKARIDSFVLGSHGIAISGLRKRRIELVSTSGKSCPSKSQCEILFKIIEFIQFVHLKNALLLSIIQLH